MLISNPTTRQIRWVLKPVAFAAAAVPLLWLIARASGIWNQDLGPNPVETVLETLGKTGLNILLLSLAVTPLRLLTGRVWLLRFRRMLGLYAFFYLVLHLLSYGILDQGLDWTTLIEDVLDRPFITVGFLGVVLMIPLALTSTQGMQRRLGTRWRALHRLAYVVATLGAVHYYWQTKADVTEPLIYFGILAALFGTRVFYWHRRRISRLGNRRAVSYSGSRSTTAQPEIPDPASR